VGRDDTVTRLRPYSREEQEAGLAALIALSRPVGSTGAFEVPLDLRRSVPSVVRAPRPAAPPGAGGRPGVAAGGLPGRVRGYLAAVRADPMLRNGLALIVSALVTQVIGVGYWVVADRYYPAATVGRNSTAISMMLFLAGVAELNLMSTLVRFLPTAGGRTRRFILTVYLASAAVAIVTGTVFLFLIPLVAPELAFLRASPLMAVWFVVSVVVCAIFVLQDSALTGIRATMVVPLENGVFSVVKIGLLIPFLSVLPGPGIFVSWTAAILLSVLPVNAYLFGRAVPRHVAATSQTAEPPTVREIRSYVVPDFLAGIFLMASSSLLPTLIIDRLGAAAAGHYALAWVIGYSLYLVSLSMGSSLVVETAGDQSSIRRRCFQAIRHTGKMLVPVVALIVVAAPYVLLVFGREYAQADAGALRLLALSALPTLITNTAISVARSQRRMRVVVGIQVLVCAVVWGMSVALMGSLGIAGVGAAWLIAQTVTAAVLIAWPRLWVPPGWIPRHAAARRGRRAQLELAREGR
jgi:O-antigen/teichoic acid export membrane protein